MNNYESSELYSTFVPFSDIILLFTILFFDGRKLIILRIKKFDAKSILFE